MASGRGVLYEWTWRPVRVARSGCVCGCVEVAAVGGVAMGGVDMGGVDMEGVDA